MARARRKRCNECGELFRKDPHRGVDRTQDTCSKVACQKARHRRQSLDCHRRQAAEIQCERLAERTVTEVTSKLDIMFYSQLATSLAAERSSATLEPSGAAVPNEISRTYKAQGSPFLRDDFWLQWRVILQALHHLALRSKRDELSTKTPVGG